MLEPDCLYGDMRSQKKSKKYPEPNCPWEDQGLRRK